MTTLIVLAILYFIPTVIACTRNHPSTAAIFVVNLLGAWTGILWLAALVWSLA